MKLATRRIRTETIAKALALLHIYAHVFVASDTLIALIMADYDYAVAVERIILGSSLVHCEGIPKSSTRQYFVAVTKAYFLHRLPGSVRINHALNSTTPCRSD